MKPGAGIALVPVLFAGAMAGTLRWTNPTLVVPDTMLARQPVLAGDGTSLWAAWWEEAGIVAAQHDGNLWHPPELVVTEAFTTITLALDADGHDPGIAYVRQQAPEWKSMYTRRTADTWTRPAEFYSDTTAVTSPVLAPHPQHGVQAAWISCGDPAHLLTAQGTDDSWTTPRLIDSFPYYLFPHHTSIARLADSRLIAAWQCYPEGRGRNLYTSIGSGDSWTRPVQVVFSPPQYVSCAPLTWMDASGVARIAWQALDTETMQDKLYSARFDGSQWVEPALLDSGGSFVGCTDTAGWGWLLYVRPNGQSLVRYHDGSNWTAPMPGPPDSLPQVNIQTAVAHGRIWVLWLKFVSETRALLYYSSAGHPLAVTEQPAPPPQPGLPVASPSVIRAGTPLHLTGLRPGQKVQLLDASGRELSTQARTPCTSSLSPGVYFLHITGGGQPVTSKVLVVE